ncbi:unnamed protein product [Phaedon cochleariae]|uniref:Uncharacterized protein n=1 Tax=Phaedon cochleariae TaxID=80249 RepID=A0A9N9SK81_PHACE|nr:unnamed protein product [Phaedon cochleariae]
MKLELHFDVVVENFQRQQAQEENEARELGILFPAPPAGQATSDAQGTSAAGHPHQDQGQPLGMAPLMQRGAFATASDSSENSSPGEYCEFVFSQSV